MHTGTAGGRMTVVRWARVNLLLGAVLAALALPAGAHAADAITEFPTPAATGPAGITTGPDGALWFTERSGPAIGRITVDGAISEYPLSAVAATPGDIVTGPDGNLWATDGFAGVVHRVTPDGDAEDIALPTNAGTDGIATGPDGALWVTQSGAGRIARVVPDGPVSELALPDPTAGPDDIVAGPDGALWFTQRVAGTVGRLTVAGAFSTTALPAGGGASPRGIAVGPDDALWVAEHDAGRLARVDPAGGPVREIALGAGARPLDVASVGGVLWATDDATAALWRVTVDGQVSRVALPAAGGGSAVGVTAGPDGAVWFTRGPDRVGRVAAVPAPVAGRSVALATVSGTVRVRRPGTRQFVELAGAGASLPVGTEVDTTSGTVRLTAAVGTASRVAKTGEFSGGRFSIAQPAGARALVTMKLTAPLARCASGRATAARRRKPSSRHLWGDAKGDFATSGHVATATVRGTRWRVTDRCDGSTQVTVQRGVVAVRDRIRHRTLTVRAGRSVVVRARR